MDKIRQCTEDLNRAVQECEALQGVCRKLEEELEAYPELREKVMAFRKRNYEIQNLKEEADVYAEMAAVRRGIS